MQRRIKFLLIALVLFAAALLPSCSSKSIPPYGEFDMVAYIGSGGLYLWRADLKQSTLLVEKKNLHRPVFSPDGMLIYYKQASDLYCYDLGTSQVKFVLADTDALYFSEDKLICLSKNRGVFRYDAATLSAENALEQPTDGFVDTYLLSNDASRAVYNLCVLDVGRVMPLGLYVTIPGSDEYDEYLPGEIGSRVQNIPKPLCWTPDGSTVLLSVGSDKAERLEVYTLPIIDGAPAPIGRGLLIPADAKAIRSDNRAFVALPAFTASSDTHETVALIDLGTLKFTFIPSGYAGVKSLDLSPDGSMIAYAAGQKGGSSDGIYIYSNGNTLRIFGELGKNTEAPTFIKDGKEICFVVFEENVGSFYTAVTNSAGALMHFTGINAPDGVFAHDSENMFVYFEAVKSR